MPRPLWSGSISFGLVNVPVKLFRAQAPRDVRFHQLHAKDGARIQQKRVCPLDGQEVSYEDIVKGYEIAPSQYVLIGPEELAALDPEATHTIDILDFVDLDEIDPLFYDKGYYVVPDARAEKPYALLTVAMRDTNKVGIAKFIMRTKEYLCALRPKDGGLVLSTMLYSDEVVDHAELDLPQLGPTRTRELDMAKQLIESLAGAFEPDKYQDEYRQKVMQLIEAKAQGNEISHQPEEREPAKVVDLMAALEASLAAAREKNKTHSDGISTAPGSGEPGKRPGSGKRAHG